MDSIILGLIVAQPPKLSSQLSGGILCTIVNASFGEFPFHALG